MWRRDEKETVEGLGTWSRSSSEKVRFALLCVRRVIQKTLFVPRSSQNRGRKEGGLSKQRKKRECQPRRVTLAGLGSTPHLRSNSERKGTWRKQKRFWERTGTGQKTKSAARKFLQLTCTSTTSGLQSLRIVVKGAGGGQNTQWLIGPRETPRISTEFIRRCKRFPRCEKRYYDPICLTT